MDSIFVDRCHADQVVAEARKRAGDVGKEDDGNPRFIKVESRQLSGVQLTEISQAAAKLCNQEHRSSIW